MLKSLWTEQLANVVDVVLLQKFEHEGVLLWSAEVLVKTNDMLTPVEESLGHDMLLRSPRPIRLAVGRVLSKWLGDFSAVGLEPFVVLVRVELSHVDPQKAKRVACGDLDRILATGTDDVNRGFKAFW